MTLAKEWVNRFEPVPELNQQQMMEDVVWYIQHYDWVSFAELAHRYGDQGKGDHFLNVAENVVLWVGLSDRLCTSIIELMQSKEIHTHSALLLTYMVDGELLRLPIAKRPPAGGYKKPHWLPATLRSGPFCEDKNCPARQKLHRESVVKGAR